jgi:hypothetical protein
MLTCQWREAHKMKLTYIFLRLLHRFAQYPHILPNYVLVTYDSHSVEWDQAQTATCRRSVESRTTALQISCYDRWWRHATRIGKTWYNVYCLAILSHNYFGQVYKDINWLVFMDWREQIQVEFAVFESIAGLTHLDCAGPGCRTVPV